MKKIIDRFSKQRQRLYTDFKSHGDPYLFFASYTQTVSNLLKTIWQLHTSSGSQNDLCLIATGGFGRGELYPYSDLDLAIITQRTLSQAQKNLISNFVSTLWDIGLFPSTTVGTLNELFQDAKNDIAKETSFLETRYIFGHSQLHVNLLSKLETHRELVDFIEAKLNELQVRHDYFKGAAKQLEPDVKKTPGGLRDIHSLLWIAKAQGLRSKVSELARNNIISIDEASLIINSHKNLARIRIHLHMLAHKNENHLFFNYHNDIARLMHCDYPDNPHQNREQMMQIFYRSTKLVRQLMEILIPMLRRRVYVPYPRKIFKFDKNYYQIGNLIACSDIKIFQKEPSQILQIISNLQKKRSVSGMAPETLRAWWLAIQNIDSSFSENPVNQELFINLFKYGRHIFEILQHLNLYGFLEKYLLDFGKIVGLLQNDLFHIYPVDDHILTVIYYLARLENENFIFESPFASNLMMNYKKKYILYLAAFFHDIGKGRSGGHEIIGARIARQFCEKHHLDTADTELIVWLVRNHLTMSITAQKKDIGDYSVIQEFAQLVATPERLVALYLLTITDIRGTNPAIWNNWKSNLIYQLFNTTLQFLQDKTQLDLKDILQKQNVVKQLIAKIPKYAQEIINFSKEIDDSFFNTQTFEDIYWQVTEISQTTNPDFFKLRFLDKNTLACIVFQPNQQELIPVLCRVFAHLNLNIIQMRTFNTKNNWLLSKFIVSFPYRCLPEDIKRITKQLEYYLTAILSKKIKTPELSIPEIFLTRRSLHSNIIPKVLISQEDYHNKSQNYFVISLVTINRNALLVNITELFRQHEIEIISININTLGERVEDSFLVKSNELMSTQNRMLFKNQLLNLCNL